MPDERDQSFDFVHRELAEIKGDVKEIVETVHKLRNAMNEDRGKQIRLEERLANQGEAIKRAFEIANGIEARVKNVELEQPVMRLVTRTMIAGAVGVIAAVGAQVFAVFKVADRPVQVVIDKAIIEKLRPVIAPPAAAQ